ncbi:type II secretion system protein [Raoultibacter phocaeensis]|uniref:type II secretion system protein n=1 Tax=Raoultibacter phocaeensis TaxID=2479841 RepID=UPI001117EB2C|nr:prepilin-type N-terminal cleavage/methylation domain-containing protein [Raoultibacter phocaeensis]
MGEQSNQRRNAGFTLAELLIVVAILLVLIAIAVPVFSGALGGSEEAVCDANRRSIKSTFYTTYTLGTDKDSTSAFNTCIAEMKAENKDVTCPSGGAFTIERDDGEGHIVVACSKHGLSIGESALAWVKNAYNGSWYTFTDPDGNKITSDQQIREQYIKQNGLTEWPAVEGIGKNGQKDTLYIEFKSYGNSADTTFLYAGTNKNPSQSDWSAYYICDTNGLLGEASVGQWYRVSNPVNGNISGAPDKTGAYVKKLLEENQNNKVSLVGDKFVESS